MSICAGITALKKKGLRHDRQLALDTVDTAGITALKKKGLRRRLAVETIRQDRWNHRPEEEGITTARSRHSSQRNGGWNHRPEEEGITTDSQDPGLDVDLGWNHRPEEEGITTARADSTKATRSAGITALKKKGLRLAAVLRITASKGWNHRPEEEGITT